jgi:transcriptional regulator GlxA family with amidase domain
LPNATGQKPIGDETRHLVLLELETRLRRLAQITQRPHTPSPHTPTSHKAEHMARWMAAHFADAVKVADIANAVNLHPNYAMNLFRKTFGVSVVDYLTQHRVAHAQQLLLTTELSVLDVAMRSGFGSSSQFYEAFKRICGLSPRKYREGLS